MSKRPRLRPRLARNPVSPRPVGAEPAPELLTDPNSLLVTRRQASRMLGGISSSMLIRLEKRRVLRAVKLTSKNGQTFYSRAAVIALAERGAAR
jgi:hypothetical protein